MAPSTTIAVGSTSTAPPDKAQPLRSSFSANGMHTCVDDWAVASGQPIAEIRYQIQANEPPKMTHLM